MLRMRFKRAVFLQMYQSGFYRYEDNHDLQLFECVVALIGTKYITPIDRRIVVELSEPLLVWAAIHYLYTEAPMEALKWCCGRIRATHPRDTSDRYRRPVVGRTGADGPAHFPIACKLLASCRFQIDDPPTQFNIDDSKMEHHKRIYQLVAMLLTESDKAGDVTAVCPDIDLHTAPPTFRFIYTKNKPTLTKNDHKISTELAALVRTFSKEPSTIFIQAMDI
jgi:hypothetical protein